MKEYYVRSFDSVKLRENVKLHWFNLSLTSMCNLKGNPVNNNFLLTLSQIVFFGNLVWIEVLLVLYQGTI